MKCHLFQLLVVPFAAFGFGCGGGSSAGDGGRGTSPVLPELCQNSSLSSFGIVGGVDLEQTSWVAKNAVFLYFKGTACTGTLIDRNIVLTAAHCVDKVKTASDLKFIFTHTPEKDSESGTLQPAIRLASEVAIHPDWKREDTKHDSDLAMVRIQTVAPSDWKTMALSRDYVDPLECTQILAAGFGKTTDYDQEDNSPIQLRAAILNPLSEETRKKTVDRMRDLVTKSENNKKTPEQIEATLADMFRMGVDSDYFYVDQSRNRGVCAGDSGGPAYMKRTTDGRVILAGVAASVMNVVEPTRKCRSIGAYTSVYFYKNWISYAFQNLRNQDSRKSDLFE